MLESIWQKNSYIFISRIISVNDSAVMISIWTDKTYGNLQCCRCLFIFHDIFHTCWSIQLSCIFKVSRAPTSHYHNILVIVLLDTRNYVTVWMTLSCYSMQLRSIHCILISSWVFTLVYILHGACLAHIWLYGISISCVLTTLLYIHLCMSCSYMVMVVCYIYWPPSTHIVIYLFVAVLLILD